VLIGDYLCHKGLYSAVDTFLQQTYATSPPSSSSSGSGSSANAAPDRRLRILDLGCGDAHCVARALESSGAGARVARYTGVDMSAPAIEIARGNLARALSSAGAPAAAGADGAAAEGEAEAEAEAACVEFVEGDMLAFARECAPVAYDLVFASFALHHLPEGQKAEMLRLLGGKVLAEGGVFVLVDIFLNQGGCWLRLAAGV